MTLKQKQFLDISTSPNQELWGNMKDVKEKCICHIYSSVPEQLLTDQIKHTEHKLYQNCLLFEHNHTWTHHDWRSASDQHKHRAVNSLTWLQRIGVYRAEQVLKFISFTFQKIVTYRKFSGNYEINHDRKKLDPEQIKKEWRRPRPANLSLFSRSLTVWIWVWGLSGWQQTVFFSPGFLLCQSWSWKYICWQNREFRKCDLFHSLFSSWEKASLCIFVVLFVMMNLKRLQRQTQKQSNIFFHRGLFYWSEQAILTKYLWRNSRVAQTSAG